MEFPVIVEFVTFDGSINEPSTVVSVNVTSLIFEFNTMEFVIVELYKLIVLFMVLEIIIDILIVELLIVEFSISV